MVNRASVKMVLRKLFYSFFLLFSFNSFGQSPWLDQNPFAVKFNQISLTNAPLDLLFPAGYDSVAQVTAQSMENQWLRIGKGFASTNNRFKVVLQNQGLVSNGFVSLMAPRAEFFTTSSQDPALIGTNDWLSLLVSHELRHIHQNNAGRHGLSKLVHGLFGANGQSAYSNLLIPNWLWEGDAVETESRINPMGRSQIPQFKTPLRAYVETFGIPSYAKMMGKSYSHLVPNHYLFGQYLSQQMTKDFGDEFIPKIWEETLNHPNLFGFSRQFKKHSGLSIDQYTKKSLRNLVDDSPRSKPSRLGFNQYLYPNILSDGRVIALKTGISDIRQLVELKQGKERRLTYFGPLLEAAMLSASNDYVTWAEIDFHPRWGQKQFSRIVFYDVKLRRKTYWNPRKKWISPSISADSKWVSFIDLLDNGHSFLRVHDRAENSPLAELKALPGEQFLQPRIGQNGLLVYISKLEGNKSICIWDFVQQKIVFRKDFGSHNIGHPYLKDDWIYFNFPSGEVDQIARFNWKEPLFEILSDERWGAYSAIPSADSLVYSAYKATGNEIVRKLILPKRMELIIQSNQVRKDSVMHDYPVKSVSKWNLINPFSWGPLLSSNGNQLEYSVISRDVLNSLQATAGLQYGMNEKQITQFARLSYQAWFPILDLNYQSGDRKTQLYIDNKRPLDSLRTDTWNQTTWDIGFRLPFNLTHSAYQENLQLGSNIGFLHVQGYDLKKRYFSEPFNGHYRFLKHQFLYSKLLNRSLRDVQPRKGFIIRSNWSGMPFKQRISGELWNVQSQLFLPGIFKHDGFLLKYAYQQESEGNYRFSSSIFFPRGYLYTSFNQLSTFGVDYRFPIVNTNINLGRILYVTRLKGNLFADFGIGKDNSESSKQSFHTLGVDLSAQFHVLRFSEGFELGVRAMFLSESKTWAFVPLVIDIGF